MPPIDVGTHLICMGSASHTFCPSNRSLDFECWIQGSGGRKLLCTIPQRRAAETLGNNPQQGDYAQQIQRPQYTSHVDAYGSRWRWSYLVLWRWRRGRRGIRRWRRRGIPPCTISKQLNLGTATSCKIENGTWRWIQLRKRQWQQQDKSSNQCHHPHHDSIPFTSQQL